MQKQLYESLARVQAFIEAHPARGPLRYGTAAVRLDEALRLARRCAGEQVSGPSLGRGEVRRQRQLMLRLRDRFVRPIVAIARAEVEPRSDVRLAATFRMPPFRLSVTRMLAWCDGMMMSAKEFEAVLVEHGMPSDFLERFGELRDELARTADVRANLTGTQVGAQEGLKWQLRRARLAVSQLDAVVRVEYAGDEAVLAEWRAAKRVRQLPSARRTVTATAVMATEGAAASTATPLTASEVAVTTLLPAPRALPRLSLRALPAAAPVAAAVGRGLGRVLRMLRVA